MNKYRLISILFCIALLTCFREHENLVQIIDPEDGEVVTGTVTITVEENIAGVDNIHFYIDDSLWYNDEAKPWEYSWPSYFLLDGTYHDIHVIAYSFSGNDYPSDTINVMIDNTNMARNLLFLNSAIINGETLSVDDPLVTVLADSSITGEVKLTATNLGEPNWVAPLAGTPSWGAHSTSYWGIEDWIPTGTSVHTTNVNLTAPSTPGLYQIYFAWGHEMDYADVMSLTHWEYAHGPIWDEGVDVADWPDTSALFIIDRGFILSQYCNASGSYGLREIPAATIRVQVQ